LKTEKVITIIVMLTFWK